MVACLLLLIVPYGIETPYCPAGQLGRLLLIVPYGIETVTKVTDLSKVKTFNRTLWN